MASVMGKHYKVMYELLKNRTHKIGCEIGVHTGLMPKHLLENLPDIQKYYAVDPWDSYMMYSGKRYRKPGNKVANTWRKALILYFENIHMNSHKVLTMRMSSVEAANHFDDESLDWIFIDANHEYEYIKENLCIWTSKVKRGGLIAGHDYGNKWKGIKKAVDEFVPEDRLKIEQFAVWWCIK